MHLNRKIAVLALATSVAVASVSAQAASVDVKVIGTITPGACTPTLAGGGTIDYGTIGTEQLVPSRFTVLDEKEVAFTVICTAPAKVAIRSVDNRAASVVPGAIAAIHPTYDDEYNFGLGTASGSKVGGFVMVVVNGSFTADGVSVSAIRSRDGGIGWSAIDGALSTIATSLHSWSEPTPWAPIAFSTLSGTLRVQAVINKPGELTLTNDIPLDGSATLELVYL